LLPRFCGRRVWRRFSIRVFRIDGLVGCSYGAS
jgi:hypothetical protein